MKIFKRGKKKYFLERLDYVKNYKERTQNSIDKIKDVQKSSLFSQKNSRSYLELIKSKNDLTKALGYEVKLVMIYGIIEVLNVLINIFIGLHGIGCLVVIFSFLMKKKWWDDNLCFQKWKIEVIDKENIYIAAVYIYICNC